ncbi:MAG: hypothetical protein KGL39_44425 [Patescibacteria group bacterium]|nr:hypothetical protein [Patescibacteria group bacterium]
MNWIKEHPYAAGAVIIGGGLLLYLITRGSGAASSSSPSLQLADLTASANLQQSQLAGQQQAQQLAAQVQAAGQQASLQAQQDQIIGGVVSQAVAGEQQLQGTGIQSALLQAELAAQNNQDTLMSNLYGQQLANQGVAVTNLLHGPQNTTTANELALVLNQGNIGSLNSSQAEQAIVNAEASAAIKQAEIQQGGGLLSTIFGGLFGGGGLAAIGL